MDNIAEDILRFNGEIKMICHTDDRGSLSNNKKISSNISSAIIQCLITNYGISKYKISSFGAGEEMPLILVNDTLLPTGLNVNKGTKLDEKFIENLLKEDKVFVRAMLRRLEIFFIEN